MGDTALEHDTPWKEIIETLFPPIYAVFLFRCIR
jgi:hypothetical protein